MKSGSLNLLEHSGPVLVCTGIALLLLLELGSQKIIYIYIFLGIKNIGEIFAPLPLSIKVSPMPPRRGCLRIGLSNSYIVNEAVHLYGQARGMCQRIALTVLLLTCYAVSDISVGPDVQVGSHYCVDDSQITVFRDCHGIANAGSKLRGVIIHIHHSDCHSGHVNLWRTRSSGRRRHVNGYHVEIPGLSV